ncbi:peptide/nickel transport system permease protein [Neorhizobium galegae]|uniref:ABC transporter permease n=1 Tax=Neorhizobium galegae TaxID=399 RepID=UPI002784385F|nr:ABC transporter permease [Neorhizobium galegae]MDQ0138090.1 peptide/nickel transport system permease protein [Neorhizobium galegae]
MFNLVIRRVAATVPVMGLVALIVFSLLYLAPGDPALVIAGDQATAAQIEQVRTNLGLNDPFWYRFGSWLLGILRGDLGNSLISNVPVSTLIMQRIEPTISLMVLTLLWSVIVAVPLAVIAAWKRGKPVDRVIMSFGVLGFSVPVFVFAYCLSYIFAIQLRWVPIQGYVPLSRGVWPWLNSLILPAVALGSSYVALISRIGRAALIEILQQDYIRTARAKGASSTSVLFEHALKNAAVPLVTVVGIGVGLLIGGAVVTETVFALPGLGRLTADSILRRDYPVIQGVVLLFSFTYVLVNLAVDLLYPLFDPRIRH